MLVTRGSTVNNIATSSIPASNLMMLCIFRRPAALRPLAGMGTFSPSLYRYPISGSSSPKNRFSQSSKLCARPKHYTQEQLAAFTNHYARLGLSNTATAADIKKAFYALSKRFHPDLMRNIDDKKYQDNPDRPKYLQIKESYELLSDPPRKKEFDIEYNDFVREIKRLGPERRAARGIDRDSIIRSDLRLDKPTTLQDGSPLRDQCVAEVLFLPPQVTAVGLVSAIAEISPVGRVIDLILVAPSDLKVERKAHVEFANDSQARRFGLMARKNHFHVNGKVVWRCKILSPPPWVASLPPPPEATRVLVVGGPKDHKLMTISALGDFIHRSTNREGWDQVIFTVREGLTNGPNSVTFECVFTSWRKGANWARTALSRDHPELSITYGKDPCE